MPEQRQFRITLTVEVIQKIEEIGQRTYRSPKNVVELAIDNLYDLVEKGQLTNPPTPQN